MEPTGGFEPATFALQKRCSTNWATLAYNSSLYLPIQLFIISNNLLSEHPRLLILEHHSATLLSLKKNKLPVLCFPRKSEENTRSGRWEPWMLSALHLPAKEGFLLRFLASCNRSWDLSSESFRASAKRLLCIRLRRSLYSDSFHSPAIEPW